MLGAEGLDLGLHEVRVHFDLVDRRHDVGVVEQLGEVVDHEVADADRADLAVRQQGLERSVRRQRAVEVRGQGLVEDQEVDLVDTQLGRGLLEGVTRLVVAVVGDPHLRLEEDLIARDLRAAEAEADLALVAVRGGGVDEAIPGAQRRLDGIRRLVGRALEDAEAEGRHDDATRQGELEGGHRGSNRRVERWAFGPTTVPTMRGP